MWVTEAKKGGGADGTPHTEGGVITLTPSFPRHRKSLTNHGAAAEVSQSII